MNNPELEEQIGLLLATLAKTDVVDAETRDLLMALQGESLRLTNVSRDASPANSERSGIRTDEETITQRLEELAVRFEADHPAIGTAIRQAIDTLVKAGI